MATKLDAYYEGKWAATTDAGVLSCPYVAADLRKAWMDGYRNHCAEAGLDADTEWDE